MYVIAVASSLGESYSKRRQGLTTRDASLVDTPQTWKYIATPRQHPVVHNYRASISKPLFFDNYFTMDEPPRKRRRTSSPLEKASSPLRKPARRPSFASPTKASLARNHPDLLTSRTLSTDSPAKSSPRKNVLARGKQARAYVLGETVVNEAFGEELLRGDDAQDTSAGARPPLKQKTIPRARSTTGNRRASIHVDAVDDEELELPATPSQRGLEPQDGPRRGVLFSSPSKRPARVNDSVKHSLLQQKARPSDTSGTEDDLGNQRRQPPAEKRPPPDPEVEKRKQEKARLLREAQELEAQVARCAEEIAKEQQRAAAHTLTHTERTVLSSFIAELLDCDSTEDESTPISNLLCSFLPFSTTAIPPPPSKVPEKRVPSHRPLEVANPLPYLEMFTTLTFSTRLDLPDGKILPSTNIIHQKHIIDIHGPQKLLTAQLAITIDTPAHQVIDMHILRLSPWASRELGTFLHLKSTTNDLGNASWALNSYWHLARKRAEYWRRCESSFTHLLTRHAENSENHPPQENNMKTMSRKDLNRHLGRDTMTLRDSSVVLKLNWRIAFDWTGEAESYVTVETAFPSTWTEGDDSKKALSKVPDTFTALMRTRGAFEATRILVELLFAR